MNHYAISESDRQELIAALESTGRHNCLAYGVKSLQPIAQAAQPAQPGWLPIESAPKDGTRYLAYALHYGQFVENHPPGHYAGDWIFDFECRHQWRGHAHCDDREATHWKPLGDQP